jgi:hypothetical protein
MVDLDPFDYTTPAGITAFLDHLAGIEDQLRLFRFFEGMLTTGEMPEYLFRRAHGIVGLLRRLVEDGCTKAITSGEERLDPAAGELPDIPQDVSPPPQKQTRKKRPRNTARAQHTTLYLENGTPS